MTLRFSGEQFGPNDYRGRLELGGTHSVEFRNESLAVLLSQMLDAHDAATGRVETPAQPEPLPAPDVAPEPLKPMRMVPRRRK